MRTGDLGGGEGNESDAFLLTRVIAGAGAVVTRPVQPRLPFFPSFLPSFLSPLLHSLQADSQAVNLHPQKTNPKEMLALTLVADMTG